MAGDGIQPARPQPPTTPPSFHGEAFLVLLMYWFGYWPGLVMNLYFLDKANTYYRATGHQAGGVGCLRAMLWVFGVLVLATIFLVVGVALVAILAGVLSNAK